MRNHHLGYYSSNYSNSKLHVMTAFNLVELVAGYTDLHIAY